MVRAAWMFALFTGCAASSPDTGSPEPPALDTADPGALTVVVSARPYAAPIEDADTLPLDRGPQGLQHVEVAVQADIPEGFHELRMALTRTRDGEPVSSPYRVGVPFQAGEAGLAEVRGLLLVVPTPGDALGEDLRLDVRVLGPDDHGRFTREVTVDWAQ